MFYNISCNKWKGKAKIWSRKSYSGQFSVDWDDLLKTDELNAGNWTQMYLDKINILLDTYALLKKVI